MPHTSLPKPKRGMTHERMHAYAFIRVMDGSAEAIAECRQYIAAGVGCYLDPETPDWMGMILSTRFWPQQLVSEITQLIGDYVQAGLLQPGRPMRIAEKEDYFTHYWALPVLHTVVREQKTDAIIALILYGAPLDNVPDPSEPFEGSFHDWVDHVYRPRGVIPLVDEKAAQNAASIRAAVMQRRIAERGQFHAAPTAGQAGQAARKELIHAPRRRARQL